MSGQKQYGLILNPAKQKAQQHPPPRQLRPSIFDEDEDDEDDEPQIEGDEGTNKSTRVVGPASGPPVPGTSKKLGYEAQLKRKTLDDIQKALAEDESVFQYDEIYDEMKAKNTKSVESEKKERKPKYVENLLKTAQTRKREQERRMERQIQKEREAEGDEFADKEAFITSAYKAKLEEMKEAEERERLEKEMEERMDVKKQQNMTGFYKNLLKQAVGEEVGSLAASIDNRMDSKKAETLIKKTDASKKQLRKRASSSESDSEDVVIPSKEVSKQISHSNSEDDEANLDPSRNRDQRRDRDLRKDSRRSPSPALDKRSKPSTESSSRYVDENDRSTRRTDKRESDDLHRSSDRRRRSRTPEPKRREKGRSRSRDRDRREKERSRSPRRRDRQRDRDDRKHRDTPPKAEEKKKDSGEEGKENEDSKSEPKLSRREIIQKLLAKRTVGEAFEEARERYLQRKESRQLHDLKVYEKLPMSSA